MGNCQHNWNEIENIKDIQEEHDMSSNLIYFAVMDRPMPTINYQMGTRKCNKCGIVQNMVKKEDSIWKVEDKKETKNNKISKIIGDGIAMCYTN
jgi:hypothetical protein